MSRNVTWTATHGQAAEGAASTAESAGEASRTADAVVGALETTVGNLHY